MIMFIGGKIIRNLPEYYKRPIKCTFCKSIITNTQFCEEIYSQLFKGFTVYYNISYTEESVENIFMHSEPVVEADYDDLDTLIVEDSVRYNYTCEYADITCYDILIPNRPTVLTWKYAKYGIDDYAIFSIIKYKDDLPFKFTVADFNSRYDTESTRFYLNSSTGMNKEQEDALLSFFNNYLQYKIRASVIDSVLYIEIVAQQLFILPQRYKDKKTLQQTTVNKVQLFRIVKEISGKISEWCICSSETEKSRDLFVIDEKMEKGIF